MDKFCENCGSKLKNGKCPKCKDNKNSNNYDNSIKWSNSKLITGIISCILFILISLQSCAVGVGNAFENSDSSSGTLGFLCALLMLIAGIISIVTRKSTTKGGSIACIILYAFSFYIAIIAMNDFPDLAIWGSFSLIFGIIILGNLIVNFSKLDFPKLDLFVLIAVIFLSIIGFFVVLLFSPSTEEEGTANNTSENNTIDKVIIDSNDDNNEVSNNKKNNYKVDETFEFDDFEISINNNYSFVKVKNRYSEYNGKTVVKIPITVKNIADETSGLNMFDYKLYGSNGTELRNVAAYFDNSIDYAGDLRPGASYTKYLYYVYDGDGEYALEFNSYKKINVLINIIK